MCSEPSCTTESISDIKKLFNNILGKKLGDMQLIMAKNPDVADSMDENQNTAIRHLKRCLKY